MMLDYDGLIRLIATVIAQAAAELALAIETGKPQYHAALFLETCASDDSGAAVVRRIRSSKRVRQRIIKNWRGHNNALAQTIGAERRAAARA